MADPSEKWTVGGTAELLSQKGPITLPGWNKPADRQIMKPKGSNRSVIVDNGMGSPAAPLTVYVTPAHDALMRIYYEQLTLVSIRRDSGGGTQGHMEWASL